MSRKRLLVSKRSRFWTIGFVSNWLRSRRKLLRLRKNTKILNGNMRFVFSSISTLSKRRSSYLRSSTTLYTMCIVRRVFVIWSSRRNSKLSKSLSRPRMLKPIRFWPPLVLTHRPLAWSGALSRRSSNWRTRQSAKSKLSWKRSERLTRTWSRLTKESSLSSVFQLKNLASILLSRRISDDESKLLMSVTPNRQREINLSLHQFR